MDWNSLELIGPERRIHMSTLTMEFDREQREYDSSGFAYIFTWCDNLKSLRIEGVKDEDVPEPEKIAGCKELKYVGGLQKLEFEHPCPRLDACLRPLMMRPRLANSYYYADLGDEEDDADENTDEERDKEAGQEADEAGDEHEGRDEQADEAMDEGADEEVGEMSDETD